MGRVAALRLGGQAGGFAGGVPPDPEPPPPDPPPPGTIVGYGSAATGGGASVTHTVNSSASGAWNALRTALTSGGALVHIKIIGSGNIDGGGVVQTVTRSSLTIDASEWTGSPLRAGLRFKGSNLILSHLRWRPGDQVNSPADTDALTLNPGTSGTMSLIVIDHCSLSWGPDVTLAVLNRVEDLTVQHTVIGPGLYESSHPQSPHSYGSNITVPGNGNPATQYGRRMTFYKNLWIHNWGRNFKFERVDGIEAVNNVVYNWGKELGHGNPRGANIVGNMFRKGPDTRASNECWEPDPNYAEYTDSTYLPTSGADRNIGLGFTPTYNISAAARLTSEYGGALHNVTCETPDATLASAVVAEVGPNYVDAVDQGWKDDYEGVTGSFWNGAGHGAPEPYWP